MAKSRASANLFWRSAKIKAPAVVYRILRRAIVAEMLWDALKKHYFYHKQLAMDGGAWSMPAMNKAIRLFGKCVALMAVAWVFITPRLFAMDLPGFQLKLTQLQRAYAADPDSPAVRDLLREMDKTFNPIRWVNEVPSRSMGSPSPERMDRINQIAGAIAPYEQLLIEIAFDKRLRSDADRAAGFLWHVAASPELKQSLLAKADGNPMAYRILFETGMFDDEVREKYVVGLSPAASPELRHQRASMASEWGLVEAIPVYLELLQKPFDPKTISFVGHMSAEDAKGTLGGYDLAALAAMHLGDAGKVLLPLIKQRFAEVQAAFPDERESKRLTGTLESAIGVLEGRRRPPLNTATNGRGVINLMVGPSPVNCANDAVSGTTPAGASKNLTPDRMLGKGTSKRPLDAQTESPTFVSWPWILGGIALLSLVGGGLLKLRRKK